MILRILFFLLLVSDLIGNTNFYMKYNRVPERVYVGQIFPVTVKTTVLTENFEDIRYKFIGGRGVERLNSKPRREKIDEDGIVSVYDTFYFKAVNTTLTIPRINLYSDYGLVAHLSGRVVSSIQLPSSKNFSGIFADNLEIYKILANRYDKTHNILTMFIRGNITNLDNIHFDEVYIKKQDIQTKKSGSFFKNEIVYYVVLPNYYDKFILKYFNTSLFKFQQFENYIDVRDDMVTTAKDLRPQIIDKNRKIKLGIALSILIAFAVLTYFYRYYTNVFLTSISFIIFIALIIPSPNVCVKNGSFVRILPMLSSTTFQTVESESIFEKVAEKGKFIKVRLSESSEGWIKEEDVCEN